MLTSASVASTLDEELESDNDDALFVEIEALIELRDASTLEEDVKRLFELAFRFASVASTLDEDNERLNEEVWSPEIEELVVVRAASRLLEPDDSERLDARMVESAELTWLRALSIDDELLES